MAYSTHPNMEQIFLTNIYKTVTYEMDGIVHFCKLLCCTSHHSVLYIYSSLHWFWLQSGQFRLSTIPKKAEIQVELGPVRCELDISIVDRLNSLLQPQKLATAELMASHLYTSYNKHVSLVRMAECKSPL